MTAIGKMMAIFVFLLSLVWTGLVVNTFVTRSNWKAEAEKYRKTAQESYEANEAMKREILAERAANAAANDVLSQDRSRLLVQIATLRTQYAGLQKAYSDKLASDRKQDGTITDLQSQIAKLQADVEEKTTRVRANEKLIDTMTRDTQLAINSKEQALRGEIAQKSRADRLADTLRNLNDSFNELKAQVGGSGILPVAARPTAPEGFRATVKARSDDFVEINLGSNAGLRVGTVLKVSRLLPEPRYLGTIVITEQLDPDRAVGEFKIRPGITRPKAEDFPTRGDEVTGTD